jgi:hypothetical protein
MAFFFSSHCYVSHHIGLDLFYVVFAEYCIYIHPALVPALAIFARLPHSFNIIPHEMLTSPLYYGYLYTEA